MDKYIVTLIQNNNRVIIPGFGAFIAREGGKKITFNELLKFDDGLLNEHITTIEKIDKKAAGEKIAQYVKDVNKKLKNNQRVVIEGLGDLSLDAKGKIQFVQSGSERPAEKKQAPAADKPTETKKEPSLAVSPPPPTTKASKEPDVEKTEPDKEEESTPPKAEEKPAPKPSAPPPPPSKQEPKRAAAMEEKPQAKTTSQTPPPDKKPPTQIKTKTEKKSNRWIVWLIIILLLIGGGIASWFIFNDEIRGFISSRKGKKQPEHPIAVIDSSEVVMDTIVELDAIPEEVEEKEIVPIDPYAKTGQFFVVAGCFRYERNADRYVDFLQQKGYNAKKFGKRKGLFTVSFDSYSTKSEALRRMREIRNSYEPQAWVLRY